VPIDSDRLVDIDTKVVNSGHLGTGLITFEELTSETKSIYRLTMDFGTETCKLCGDKGRPDWQVDLFNGEWGFLCGPCGLRLSEKLNESS
jgi:hypothetical protein